MNCRIGCGACCIAISISTPIPGMPNGKAGGVRCVQLTEDNRCKLFTSSTRPAVCEAFRPAPDTCGASQAEALAILGWLEKATSQKD